MERSCLKHLLIRRTRLYDEHDELCHECHDSKGKLVWHPVQIRVIEQ